MNIGADSEARASPPVQELSEDQVRDKTEATLKEFLNIKDFKVTIVDCVLISSAIKADLFLVHRPRCSNELYLDFLICIFLCVPFQHNLCE